MLDARAWDPDLRKQIGLAAAAMLLVRADHYDPGETSEQMAGLLSPGADEDEPHRHDSDPVPWVPALMPADVRTVDLLQAVLDEREDTLPVAIIISASDRVIVPALPPSLWVAAHTPLLDQFLVSHSHRLSHAVFGVSAQGGDFSVGLAEPVKPDETVSSGN